MRRFVALGLLLLLPHNVVGETPALSVREMAERIDRRLAEKWQGIEPAALADDAAFLRRISLDLVGRIPRASEVREFLADPAADKRARAVERLLASPLYAVHFGGTWRQTLLASTTQQVPFANAPFKAWLERQFRDDVPYDRMARELLTVPISAAGPGMAAPQAPMGPPPPSPLGFYQAQEFKPENVAAGVSRVFLGIRLECAQCHDHFFARWERRQFWELAAFFPSIRPQSKQPDREIVIPGIDRLVRARFLDGPRPKWKPEDDTRAVLADWMTSPKNPFFARAAVNRLWHHFFGYGIIEPLDEEPTDEQPASHPELLQELAEQFVAHRYDVKTMIRALVLSRAYQLSSRQTHPSQAEPRLFARRGVRGLTPEQLFDSLVVATGFREAAPAMMLDGSPRGSARAEFLNRFASQDSAAEKQTSILQALALMNGKVVGEATNLDRSRTLAAIAEAPFLTPTDRVEALYLATLSRRPRPEELDRFVTYLGRGGTGNDAQAALGDVFWVLLNSPEFSLNR